MTSDVLLRRMTASLAHNVNNALTGVIGYLELALSGPTAPAEVGGCIRSGLQCAHQAADAVRRIVGCSRRIAEAEPPAACSLRRLAQEAADRLAGEAPHVPIAVVGVSPGPVFVSADLVGAALDALLHAMVWMNQGALTLRLAEENGQCVLYVESTGGGASNLLLRLLEASLMIEIQGGAVEALSATDQSASVRVSLPRRVETPIRRDDAQPAPSPHMPVSLSLLRQAV
ncbi:MAG TPA: hypothetical protein VMS17_32015 [Gemmataceae bacterium]|nr:hypothetical protein [Gemmataceae bacterium]